MEPGEGQPPRHCRRASCMRGACMLARSPADPVLDTKMPSLRAGGSNARHCTVNQTLRQPKHTPWPHSAVHVRLPLPSLHTLLPHNGHEYRPHVHRRKRRGQAALGFIPDYISGSRSLASSTDRPPASQGTIPHSGRSAATATIIKRDSHVQARTAHLPPCGLHRHPAKARRHCLRRGPADAAGRDGRRHHCRHGHGRRVHAPGRRAGRGCC